MGRKENGEGKQKQEGQEIINYLKAESMGWGKEWEGTKIEKEKKIGGTEGEEIVN